MFDFAGSHERSCRVHKNDIAAGGFFSAQDLANDTRILSRISAGEGTERR
jgi:hypothetical protein